MHVFTQQQKKSKEWFPWLTHYQRLFAYSGFEVLAWWHGTTFADMIYRDFGFFPILRLTGASGSGKSAMLRFLWKLFGRENYEGFDPTESTARGCFRSLREADRCPAVMIAPREPENVMMLKTLFNGRFCNAIADRETSGLNESYTDFTGGVLVVDDYNVLEETSGFSKRVYHVDMKTLDRSSKWDEASRLLLHRMTCGELEFFSSATAVPGAIYQSFCKYYDGESKGDVKDTPVDRMMMALRYTAMQWMQKNGRG